MKLKLTLEIEAPDHLKALPSVEEIRSAISRGFYEYFGNWVAQNIELKLSSAEDKPLDMNKLENAIRRNVAIDYNEQEEYLVMDDERAEDYLDLANVVKPEWLKQV